MGEAELAVSEPALPPGFELQDTVQAVWATLAPKAETIQGFPRSTIVPSTADPDSAGQRAMERLEATSERGLDMGETLGEGGMGVVRLATQTSVGRKVAVKTLRACDADRSASMKLLREGWLTASLEHPNVVPVHDVTLDEDGHPVVVLKRIEGVEWSELLDDDEGLDERFGEGDRLGHNLSIFMEVCQAIAFAHSRGIIHRDLKPENVMVGEFGEVYVLDWGLAVSTRDDPSGRLPLARDARVMAGTPSYMAPEMLGPETQIPLSEKTDIYLLGALLYELVEGRPPHGGDTAMALVSSVLRSQPSFAEGAPTALVDLITGCMARDPAERPADAHAVLAAVRTFLHHRASFELSERAQSGLRALLAHVEVAEPTDPEQRALAYHLFGACRFGFQEALAGWAENPDAGAGLTKAVEAMIAFELAGDDPRAASPLLAELSAPDPKLSRRVRRAVERHRAKLDELEALDRAHDTTIGQRTRLFTGTVLGLSWTLAPIIGSRFDAQGMSHRHTLTATSLLLVLALGLGYWARDSLTKTEFNRRATGIVLAELVAQPLVTLVALYFDVPRATALQLYTTLWFGFAMAAVVSIDRRFVGVAIGYFAGLVGVTMRPDAWPWIMTATHAVTVLHIAWVWRPPGMLGQPGPEPESALPSAAGSRKR